MMKSKKQQHNCKLNNYLLSLKPPWKDIIDHNEYHTLINFIHTDNVLSLFPKEAFIELVLQKNGINVQLINIECSLEEEEEEYYNEETYIISRIPTKCYIRVKDALEKEKKYQVLFLHHPSYNSEIVYEIVKNFKGRKIVYKKDNILTTKVLNEIITSKGFNKLPKKKCNNLKFFIRK